MKYWHRRIHLIVWLLIIPCLSISFWYAGYLLKHSDKEPNQQQQDLLDRIERRLNQQEENL